MYGLMARCPGLLLILCGFGALFDGGWYTLGGLAAIPAGCWLLKTQVVAGGEREAPRLSDDERVALSRRLKREYDRRRSVTG